MTPKKIVQQQVEAYNERDIEKFVACHSETVELYQFSAQQPFATGSSKLKEIYQDVFENSPTLNAEIVNRIVFDNKVIDHEFVTGRKGIEKMEIIAIYEVVDGLIAKAYFMRKD